MTSIVLVHPEIPHNTGAIGRTCVALDMDLVLIRPYGFTLSDRQLQRAGLDYWQHVRLAEFASWGTFMDERQPLGEQLFLFEDDAGRSFYEPDYPDDAYLVFGSETKGLPKVIRDAHADREVRLPMRSPHIRSLNLANAVTAAAYQALRGSLT
ncbi:tRNA (cytidine(34)-2'-O)-methyltransferase [Aurantiacibacter aquimixticola]|uniref:tRNA (cytidine(34)-2'-O)-methyltransferase n=1 Tax=Aurantiacibacter aquimixticola TaxID=1958945 RepID=A0A419RTE0_9SPHN|nr:tRNA (cytidine(34)-2'-O)-methyltransferase [Aurantiacibacter aquimixticola]RJY09061.1 tRNA (cytidine(34)-2'-O)-methyltransferase [Aurantiacibacter aquimixticola]